MFENKNSTYNVDVFYTEQYLPVDPVNDVVEHQVADEFQTDMSWKRPPPPFLPTETRRFGFEVPFFTGPFGPHSRT